MSRFMDVADFITEGDEEDRKRREESARRMAELAERLDALLIENPALGYFRFDADSDWPASRYDEVWRAAVWLSGFGKRDARPKCSSYGLKHIAEKATNGYISNGSLIAAALLSEISVNRIPKTPNASVGIPVAAAKAAFHIAEGTETFGDLAVIEPRLKSLAASARAYKKESHGQRRACANERWYGYFEWRDKGLKERLCELVGWESENPLLDGARAYDVAYKAIYAMLPYCKNCGCYPP